MARGEGGRAQDTTPRKGSQTSRSGILALSSISQEGQEKMLQGPHKADPAPFWVEMGRRRIASDPIAMLTFESFWRGSAYSTE